MDHKNYYKILTRSFSRTRSDDIRHFHALQRNASCTKLENLLRKHSTTRRIIYHCVWDGNGSSVDIIRVPLVTARSCLSCGKTLARLVYTFSTFWDRTTRFSVFLSSVVLFNRCEGVPNRKIKGDNWKKQQWIDENADPSRFAILRMRKNEPS